ncbi:hypothetical protein MetMK1DRAFT_00011470 [Metallosphaera yellowstonensis MK1]|jgi:hypothetical protein|uniref:Uncharacterized protein n=1 Tax=Metallosphaera yellowstonensis MK1 TaxID=671065 RepID=H2C323_9CREN|nr:hypothetical protein MetMK1DRAFT_00011470 [Metallosphaera yellowstonensis MK1]
MMTIPEVLVFMAYFAMGLTAVAVGLSVVLHFTSKE